MADCVNLFTYAKSIRKAGEKWQDAIKRASVEVKEKNMKFCAPPKPTGPRKQKTFRGKTKSECSGLPKEKCVGDCSWVKETKTKSGQVRKAHCAVKKAGPKKAKSITQAREMTFPRVEERWTGF